MFENFNKKIKILAEVIAIGGCVLSFLYSMGIYNDKGTVDALCGLCVGILLSFVCSFLLYGFGELISYIRDIRNKIAYNQEPSDSDEEKNDTHNEIESVKKLENKETVDNINDGSNN